MGRLTCGNLVGNMKILFFVEGRLACGSIDVGRLTHGLFDAKQLILVGSFDVLMVRLAHGSIVAGSFVIVPSKDSNFG